MDKYIIAVKLFTALFLHIIILQSNFCFAILCAMEPQHGCLLG